jgi:simple sugar transport system permease protein
MVNELIASALLLATPLVIVAQGGLVNKLGGVVNIGLEGQMLLGALTAATVSGVLHSWLIGVVAAALAGAVAGLLMSVVITRLKANEIIVGLGFNIVIAGAIGYVLRSVLGVSGTLRVQGLDPLPQLNIPGLRTVPVLGAVLSGKDPLFWFAIVLIPLVAWVLRATPAGLRLRATGAAEDATRSLGLSTTRIRDATGVTAGLLAGIAGAQLSLGQVGLFNEQMVSGRGYIALAAFYFGRSRPWPTAAACLIFAFFDALQVRLQINNIPADLVQTLPYVVVVAVLAVSGIRDSRTPRPQGRLIRPRQDPA